MGKLAGWRSADSHTACMNTRRRARGGRDLSCGSLGPAAPERKHRVPDNATRGGGGGSSSNISSSGSSSSSSRSENATKVESQGLV